MRVMRKTLGWVLVLAMIISMFPAVYATADDTARIELRVENDDTMAMPGDEISVDIFFVAGSNQVNLQGFQAYITFNSEKVAPASTALTNTPQGWIASSSNAQQGLFIILAGMSSASIQAGNEYKLGTVKFTVLENGELGNAAFGIAVPMISDSQSQSIEADTTSTADILVVDTGINLPETSVTVEGGSTDATTLESVVLGTNGNKITENITWTVTGPESSDINDVKIENGIITIANNAPEGDYTITATLPEGSEVVFDNNELSASAVITVTRADSVASSIDVVCSDSNDIIVPDDESEAEAKTFTATVTDQFGDTMSADIQWSVSAEDGTVLAGITIENGTLKVGNEAKTIITDTTGKELTVTAKSGTLTDTATVTVKRAASVATSVDIYKDATAISSDTIAIPQNGSTSVTYTAKVLDQYGSEMTAGNISWSYEGSLPSGVGVNYSTVTVAAGATMGEFTLKAACDGISDSAAINIASISFGREDDIENALTISKNPTYGMTWGEIVQVDGSKITANVGGTPVEGKYSIKDADTIPNAGEQAYTIVFNGSGYNDVTVYKGTVTIAQQTVTVDGITVSDKEYDGNTNAKVSTEGAVVSVKDVTVTGATGTFVDANVGTDKAVTVEIELSNSNYAVEDLTLTADITAKALTADVTSVDVSKVYDGTTAPGTVTGSASVTDTVGSETVTVNVTAGNYPAKDVGSSYTVELTLELAGDAAKNYVLGSTTATITDAAITACGEFTDATSKAQNVVVGVGSFAAPSFTGIDGEAVTGTTTYNSSTMDKADIESELAKLAAGDTAIISYSFTASGNYTGTITGEIAVTMVDIAFTGVDEAITVASDAVYGDTWADIVTVDASKIDAAVGTEEVAGTYTVENSNTRPNAGTVTYKVLFNSNDGRYVNVEVVTGTVTVAKKPVSITGLDVADKTYDGNTSAIVSGTATLDGVLAGDTVSVAAGTASFADKNVGTEKNVIFRDYSLSGTDANNYELSAQPSATANITAKPVTITGVAAANKTYDGTTTAQITGTAVISGKVGDDDVEVVNGTAAFADANVGNGISITFSGFSLSGADAGNYELTAQPVSVTANITKADYTNAPELNINIIMNQADAQTGTLTALNFFGGNMPAGATITAVALSGTDSNVIEGISVDDGSLAYASATNITAAEGTSEAYDVTISTKNYNDITATLTFTTVAKTPVTISGVSVADKVYNGQAASYTGTPVATADGEAVEVSKYTYTWQNTDGTVLSSAPVNAGSYKLVIAVTENDPNYVGSTTVNFTISKATVTITVDDKEAYVGSDMPDFSYIVSGLAAGETLAAYPTLTCSADMDEPGEYTITASGAAVPATGNYNETITYVPGTLTVSRRPINVGPTYDIDVADSENGSVKASLGNASEGSVITLTVTPDEGYRLGSITVIDENGNEVEVRRSGSEYKFTMPDGDVRVSARFVRDTGALPFNDVKPGDWFYEYVAYVYNNGIMDGVDSGVFSPNTATTRGMVVTVLYRLYGEPAVSGGSFTDVAPGAYYADAVAWASNAGIVNGTSATTFSPNDLVTREQFAAMLYRYMQYTGADTSARASLSGFADAGRVSSYAADALAWAVAEGVLNGRSATEITPQGNCTRAEVAAMITRVFG